MENSLENLSKDQLLALLQKETKRRVSTEEENTQLKFQVEYYKRLAFGQKRERFEGDKDQMSLPFEMDPETAQKQQEEVKEKLTYERRKRKSNHKGRMPLPEHLPVEEIEIYPSEDTTDMVCIGKEVTDSNPRNESLNYCFQERNSSRAKFYLLGDSHAQSLLPMVRNSFPQEEMDVIALPNGDDYINSFWQKENLEIHKIPKISKLLANSLQDDFVGISFHRGHLNDELNKDIHVSLNKEVTSNKKELVATKNFMDLIELLQQRKLKIILFRDVPLLISPSIPISSCMLNEKLFSTDLCEVSKKQDIHTRMRQDRLIDFLALKYSLPVFDPSQYMYKTNEDNSFSWRNSEGFQIMTDHSHMSAEYASLISENFTEFLNNIKLNSGINSSSNSPQYHSNTGDKYD